MMTATFGGGCFWCTEAIFSALNGVEQVTSGYAGGHVERPTYDQVSSGTTGHAECIQILFDPDVITYEQVLEVFFLTHDPTTVNRQGHDSGTQYRSIILVHDETQRAVAERVRSRVTATKIYDQPIVTEIVAYTGFTPAEPEHQRYFERNPDQPYCSAIISPKLAKFRQSFEHLYKHEP